MAKTKAVATDAPIEVTKENFGELLLEGAAEAVEIHEGRAAPARVHSYPALTARDVEVEPAPVPSPDEIRGLREAMNVSQDVFAQIFNVSTFTDRSWEQGHRVPDGAALRLFQIAKKHPRIVLCFAQPKRAAARRATTRKARPAARRRAG